MNKDDIRQVEEAHLDPEASKAHFDERIAAFEATLNQALSFSNKTANLQVKTRFAWASYLYTKLCATGISLCKFLQIEQANNDFTLDHTSFCALARNMLETSLMFAYLAQRGIGDEQWNLRRDVLWLHDAVSRYKYFKAWKDKDQVDGFAQHISKLILDVSSSKVFQGLEEERRKRILAGSEMYVNGLRSAARVAGWDKQNFDGIYTYLSQHCHSAPVSFLRMADHGVDYQNPGGAQLAIASLALEIATLSIQSCSRRLAEIYPDKLPDHGFDQIIFDTESPLISSTNETDPR